MIGQELWDKFQENCWYQRRWCEKNHYFIRVQIMRLESCNECPLMVLNGGVCDPI